MTEHCFHNWSVIAAKESAAIARCNFAPVRQFETIIATQQIPNPRNRPTVPGKVVAIIVPPSAELKNVPYVRSDPAKTFRLTSGTYQYRSSKNQGRKVTWLQK
jgi:hypothetical protein